MAARWDSNRRAAQASKRRFIEQSYGPVSVLPHRPSSSSSWFILRAIVWHISRIHHEISLSRLRISLSFTCRTELNSTELSRLAGRAIGRRFRTDQQPTAGYLGIAPRLNHIGPLTEYEVNVIDSIEKAKTSMAKPQASCSIRCSIQSLR